MRLIIIALGFCILLSSLASAFPCEGGNFTVGRTSLTSATGIANSSDYSPRTASVWWFGELNVTGGDFSAYSGLFDLLRVPTPPPTTSATVDSFNVGLKSTYFDERTRKQEPYPFIGCEWTELGETKGEYEICNDDSHNVKLDVYTVGYPTTCGNTADFIYVEKSKLYLAPGECENIYIEARYPLASNCTETFYNDPTALSHRFGVMIDGRGGTERFIPVERLSPTCEGEFCWWWILVVILIILTAYYIYRKRKKKENKNNIK